MYTQVVFLCWVVLTGVWGQEERSANCSSLGAFLSECQSCLDNYDVPFTLPDPEALARAPQNILSMLWLTDNTTEIICKAENRENYIKASICAYDIMRNCSGQGNTLYHILIPHPGNARLLVQQDCDDIGDYNRTCAVSQVNEISRCANFLETNKHLGTDQCSRIQGTRYCAKQELQTCGDATVQMYLENLVVPESCHNITDPVDMECISNATTACQDKQPQSNSTQLCKDTKAFHLCLVNAVSEKCSGFLAFQYEDVLTSQLPETCSVVTVTPPVSTTVTVVDNSAYRPTLSVCVLVMLSVLLFQ